jgi:hypothetical protein
LGQPDGHVQSSYGATNRPSGKRFRATDTLDRQLEPLRHGSSIGFQEDYLCRPSAGNLWDSFGTS